MKAVLRLPNRCERRRVLRYQVLAHASDNVADAVGEERFEAAVARGGSALMPGHDIPTKDIDPAELDVIEHSAETDATMMADFLFGTSRGDMFSTSNRVKSRA